jgi:PAS domain S-box-containing protein
VSEIADLENTVRQLVLAQLPAVYWVVDRELRITHVGGAIQDLFGYSEGDFVGKHVAEAYVTANRSVDPLPFHVRALQGEIARWEAEYDGRSLKSVLTPLRNDRGDIVGAVGTSVDITAQRTIERRARDALRIGRMGFLDWDLVANEIEWSPETYRLFGFVPEEYSPTVEGTVGLIPVEERAYVWGQLEAAIQGSAEFDVVHRILRPDGKVIHVHAQSKVIRDADGKALRMLGTVVDISELKRAEQELLAVDRRRSEFIAMLSHELRNPLGAIRSGLYLLQRASASTAEARDAMAVIDRQSRHLARMVDDLLDVTRIDSGNIQLRRSAVDLVELTRRAIDDYSALVGSRIVELDLPDAPIWLDADATRLAQVLGNLISNAVKFTSETGKIAIKLGIVGGSIVLEVADNGAGMDGAMLAQLFKPFMQADRSLDRSRGGLGLGLAIVKALVELHGGAVTVMSDGPGRGACFRLTLPPREAAPTTHVTPTPPLVSRARKILIIEDNAETAIAMARVFALWKHQVEIAYDGGEGLEKARNFGPDVIVCDVGLPGTLDGYAVARALQADPRLAAVYRIALTGYVQPEDRRRAKEAGFHAHLAKPVDLDMLERMLAELPA